MLNIVTQNERSRCGSSIEGYITEVLHREYMNVTNEMVLDQVLEPLPFIFQQLSTNHNIHNHHTSQPQTTQLIPNNNVTNSPILNRTNICMNSIQTSGGNNKPQIIKLQPFVSNQNINQSILTSSTTNNPTSKQVIYMSQSPVKTNKLIKIGSNNVGGSSMGCGASQPQNQLSQNQYHEHIVKTECAEQPTHNMLTLQQIHQPQNQQIQQQQHQQQVLNLVLVTDGLNGEVRYLSLVPQN